MLEFYNDLDKELHNDMAVTNMATLIKNVDM